RQAALGARHRHHQRRAGPAAARHNRYPPPGLNPEKGQQILNAIRGAAVMSGALLPLAFTPTRAGEDTMVKIDNFTFAPQKLTVKAGTTITWVNEDDIPHTVVATTLAFRSKALDTDDKFTFTFSTPGTFEYFCSLHPKMTGTIVVEAAGAGAVR